MYEFDPSAPEGAIALPVSHRQPWNIVGRAFVDAELRMLERFPLYISDYRRPAPPRFRFEYYTDSGSFVYEYVLLNRVVVALSLSDEREREELLTSRGSELIRRMKALPKVVTVLNPFDCRLGSLRWTHSTRAEQERRNSKLLAHDANVIAPDPAKPLVAPTLSVEADRVVAQLKRSEGLEVRVPEPSIEPPTRPLSGRYDLEYLREREQEAQAEQERFWELMRRPDPELLESKDEAPEIVSPEELASLGSVMEPAEPPNADRNDPPDA